MVADPSAVYVISDLIWKLVVEIGLLSLVTVVALVIMAVTKLGRMFVFSAMVSSAAVLILINILSDDVLVAFIFLTIAVVMLVVALIFTYVPDGRDTAPSEEDPGQFGWGDHEVG